MLIWLSLLDEHAATRKLATPPLGCPIIDSLLTPTAMHTPRDSGLPPGQKSNVRYSFRLQQGHVRSSTIFSVASLSLITASAWFAIAGAYEGALEGPGGIIVDNSQNNVNPRGQQTLLLSLIHT